MKEVDCAKFEITHPFWTVLNKIGVPEFSSSKNDEEWSDGAKNFLSSIAG